MKKALIISFLFCFIFIGSIGIALASDDCDGIPDQTQTKDQIKEQKKDGSCNFEAGESKIIIAEAQGPENREGEDKGSGDTDRDRLQDGSCQD